ncbi:MAG: polysaccharide deacetylase family protein, partial [Phycisphaerales bacterium]
MIQRRDIRPGRRRRALEGAWSVFNATGLDRGWARHRGLAGATILMYHAVTDEHDREWIDPSVSRTAERFERQMRFLAEHRAPVSLTELVEMVEAGETPEAGTVVVTFDDAYLNTARVAGPILARHGVPATLFVVSGWADSPQSPWIDRLFSAF